ncbi:hypothetical protein GUITHDRAFT_66452, partial [Guillardia theta CCMP2712]
MLGPGTECLPCPKGTYAHSSSTSCTTCPDVHSTTQEDRSISLTDCFCLAGYFGTLSLNQSCSICPPNHFCPRGAAQPTPCPAGSSSPRGTKEVTDCVCNPGYTGPNGGPCSVCLPGSSCEGGWVDPLSCPSGTFSTQGQTFCTHCTRCPANSTSIKGSTSVSQCTCIAGYAGSISQLGGNCSACPAGSFSLGNWSSCCSCPAGSTSEEASPSADACMCDVG